MSNRHEVIDRLLVDCDNLYYVLSTSQPDSLACSLQVPQKVGNLGNHFWFLDVLESMLKLQVPTAMGLWEVDRV
jgi:hypothetical protein